MTHTQRPLARFTNRRESLGQQILDGFASFNAGTEIIRFGLQLRVTKLTEAVFERVDRFYFASKLLDRAIVAATDEFFDNISEHYIRLLSAFMDEVSNWDTTIEILQLFRDLARRTDFYSKQFTGLFLFISPDSLDNKVQQMLNFFIPTCQGQSNTSDLALGQP